MMSDAPKTTRGIQRAGGLIAAGLLVQTGTFWGNGADAFMLFACLGLSLTGLGIATYLWTIASAD